MRAVSQSMGHGAIAGTVTDVTGARVPDAVVRLLPAPQHGNAKPVQADRSDAKGLFHLEPAPGRYTLEVEAPGFAAWKSGTLALQPNASLTLQVRMVVETLQQQVSAEQQRAEGIDPDSPAGAVVFEGEGLNLLSNDSATLKQQLSAIAGGLGTPHFLIDGFSGGNLPPKASIRSIRIGQNAFSALYSEFGSSRVMIDTKPGADKLHGKALFSGTNQPFNARNPYTPVAPPFYDFQNEADLDGPISRSTSFFVSENLEQLANNAVVNAADPSLPGTQISTAVPNPQLTQTYSLRLDHQFNPHHFTYLRDEWSQSHVRNSGIQPLVLPEAAFTSNTETETLQLADTHLIGAHAVNEARFQYLRTRLSQSPNSILPSVLVQGAFQSGGNPGQSSQDNQDAYEGQERFEFDRGHHSMRVGIRLRSVRDANRSNAGFNGQYIFSDLASFLNGQASQYSQTVGLQSSVLSNTDFGLYAEDDWEVTPHLTLSYGIRFESQTALPDGADLAPRIGFSWAVGKKKTSDPLFTLHGGYGIFYDRFPLVQLLQSVRQDGQHQTQYLVQDVGYDPAGPPPGVALTTAAQPTLYQVSPRYRSPSTQVAMFSVLRSFRRYGTMSGNFVYMHEAHSLLTRNLNAPLPGTFHPDVPGSGVRPLGDLNLYQFSSDANGNLERFYLNYRVALGSRVLAFGVFDADKHRSESDGISSFPVDQYDLRLDYARNTADQARIYTGGFSFQLPFGVQMITFVAAHSGVPFTVTTGTDLNGDTIYNDRPAPATQSPSAGVVQTRYGAFDVRPLTASGIIRRNSELSPAYAWVQLQASRDFHLGPRPRAASDTTGQAARAPERPWDLSFSVEIHNLTNRNNPGVPVGVIGAQPCGSADAAPCPCSPGTASGCALAPSRLFGRSLSLAGDFSPITASNRTILLQTSFSW